MLKQIKQVKTQPEEEFWGSRFHLLLLIQWDCTCPPPLPPAWGADIFITCMGSSLWHLALIRPLLFRCAYWSHRPAFCSSFWRGCNEVQPVSARWRFVSHGVDGVYVSLLCITAGQEQALRPSAAVASCTPLLLIMQNPPKVHHA